MADNRERERAEAAMRRINHLWLQGRVDDLAPLVHPDVVVVVPGFAARAQGRDAFLRGFREFSDSATIAEISEHDHHADVVGNTAVVTFRYDMLYERRRERYRVSGRDLWVFERTSGEWIAVWRAMLELDEKPA